MVPYRAGVSEPPPAIRLPSLPSFTSTVRVELHSDDPTGCLTGLLPPTRTRKNGRCTIRIKPSTVFLVSHLPSHKILTVLSGTHEKRECEVRSTLTKLRNFTITHTKLNAPSIVNGGVNLRTVVEWIRYIEVG